MLPLRVFFFSLRSLDVDAFRLLLSCEGDVLEVSEALRSVGRGRLASTPKATDCGTMRSVEGSIMFDGRVVVWG